MLKLAITFTGRSRTTNSPGTPLRRPNSSARSGPTYRAAIAAAVASKISRILGQLCHSLNLDEPGRQLLKVNADRGARIAGKRPALSGVLAGIEHQLAVVDHEPHRSDQRPPIGGAVAQLARPRPLQQEGANLRIGHRRHASQSKQRTPAAS